MNKDNYVAPTCYAADVFYPDRTLWELTITWYSENLLPRVVLTRTSSPSEYFSVLMCYMHVVFLCFIFVLYEIFLDYVVLVLYAGCKKYKKTEKQKWCVVFFCTWNAFWYFVLYVFSTCRTRSVITLLYFPLLERALALLSYIFPRVEYALALLCYIFRAWNALWHYCVIFPACGTRSGVIVLYFPCVKRNMEVLCYNFRVSNALWSSCVIFSACRTCSVILC